LQRQALFSNRYTPAQNSYLNDLINGQTDQPAKIGFIADFGRNIASDMGIGARTIIFFPNKVKISNISYPFRKQVQKIVRYIRKMYSNEGTHQYKVNKRTQTWRLINISFGATKTTRWRSFFFCYSILPV
jgi:hypothetical protein